MCSFSQKIKQQEEKERKVNSLTSNNNHKFSELSVTKGKKDRLNTIQERETENPSKLITEEKEHEEIHSGKLKEKYNQSSSKYIIKEKVLNNSELSLKKQKQNEEEIKKNKLENNIKITEINNNPDGLHIIKDKNIQNNNINNNTRILNPESKLPINIINQTISDQRNLSKLPSQTNKSSMNSVKRKLANEEFSNSNIELIEESLLKSLTTINHSMRKDLKLKLKTMNTTINSIKHEIYNGNTDKVASYQYLSNVWSKTPFLQKTKSSSKIKINNTTNEFSCENVNNGII